MSEEDIMKVLAASTDPEDNGQLLFFAFPNAASTETVARQIVNLVGVGNPFFAFYNSSIPASLEAAPAWDPADAPICSENVGANAANITTMLSDVALQTLPNDKVRVAS
jgi:hypothetical protein